ncbi:MAG TPA: fatty acid desaturase [Acidimicrobiales bacterium]|nr:fatty acid desaturase [Acidimicrobiales bacterium]
MPGHLAEDPDVRVVPLPIALPRPRIGEVRAGFSDGCYRRRPSLAVAWLLVDLALYALPLAGALLARSPVARLAWGGLAGVGVAVLFVWAHDAAHGALFRSGRWAEVLGTAAMLPSLQLYRPWVYGHNRVHHGFTALSPIDWIWRPLTPDEYRSRSRWGRAAYRAERHWAGCGLHYLVQVWWKGMVRFRPDDRRRRSFRAAKAGTVAFAVALSAVAWRATGSWTGVAAAVVVPFLVFTWIIALVVYLHHTHPDVPFFADRDEWSPALGSVRCSTVIRSNPVVETLSHNIFIHAPHHVDSRIPFYRLPLAWEDLRRRYGADVVQYRLRAREVRRIFRTCQLYEFDTHTWRRFAEV